MPTNKYWEVPIVKLVDNAKVPTMGTEDSAGVDFYVSSFENYTPEEEPKFYLHPGDCVNCHTGLAMALPKGTYLAIVPRSGMANKKGITNVDSPATIDADYRGEISIKLINHSDKPVIISVGDRIAQGILMEYQYPKFILTDKLDSTARGNGGFGSTGDN